MQALRGVGLRAPHQRAERGMWSVAVCTPLFFVMCTTTRPHMPAGAGRGVCVLRIAGRRGHDIECTRSY